jgi:serine/threonine protein kinase/Flp pilus assembly protein TadD
MNELIRHETLSGQTDAVLNQLIEDYENQLAAGEAADPEAFIAQHPEHTEALRRVLPVMQVLVSLESSSPASSNGSDGAAATLGVLGDFLMIREVGRGGMGIVYEAEQISLGRRVALKVLPFASTLDPKQLQRFKNEAQAAAHLHHQNIVPVHATGCERGVHYYAMQFIEGQTLAQVIADLHDIETPSVKSEPSVSAKSAGEPTVAGTSAAQAGIQTPPIACLSTQKSTHGRAFFHAIARLGIQAAEALDYSHELGIIHRDIKPANMLVDARGKLWITDFGLAHCQSQAGLTMSGDLVGTLRYMSPEQALAKRVIVDHRTDIYSLGATLYELLTGEPVFTGHDRQELLRQIAFEEPKPLRRHHKAIPAELETIVLKALEKNPADRYATAREVAEDLERFVKDEPIRARRPSVARRVRGFCRRHRAMVWSASLALLAVALTTAASVGWLARDQAARQIEAVREDLREADTWQRENQWPRALKALERAQGRIYLAGPESLRADVEQRRREAAFVVELEKIPLQMVDVGGPDIAGAERAYAQVFAANGLDVAAHAPEEIARRIKAMGIRVHVLGALDYWAYSKEGGHYEMDKRREGGGAALRAIAHMVDDDPWRRELRDPRLINDRAALENLAKREDILAQPPESFLFLASLLDKANALPAGVELLRKGNRVYPSNFMINYMLGYYLTYSMLSPASADEAIGFARAAVSLNPQSPAAYLCVASAIGVAKKPNGWDNVHGVSKAIELKPDYAAAYNHQGMGFLEGKKYAEAEAAFHMAIKLKPNFAIAHNNLGRCLAEQGKLPAAEKAFRTSIEKAPNYWSAYYNLGLLLSAQQNFKDAEEAYRNAIKRMPNDESDQRKADVHNNLGTILLDKEEWRQAEEAFGEAIRLDPKNSFAHNNLGYLLAEQQRLPEAIKAYKKAIDVKPDNAQAYYNMGDALYSLAIVLRDRAKLTEAIKAYDVAILLDGNKPWFHFSLGLALEKLPNLPEAIKEYDTAIRIEPAFAEAHAAKAFAQMQQGQVAAGLDSIKRSHKLYSGHAWAYHSGAWVRLFEQFALLADKLPKLASGEIEPANTAERIAQGWLYQQGAKQLYAGSARRYAEVFAAEPTLANDLGAGHRYNAACAAAQAGCAQGKDAANMTPDERTRFRKQALAWLRQNLSVWQSVLANEPGKSRSEVASHMRYWRTDGDLSCVRGAASLAQLPEAESQEWQRFWEEVNELRKQAESADSR